MHYYTRLTLSLQHTIDTYTKVEQDIRNNDVPVPDRILYGILGNIDLARDAIRRACDQAFVLASAAPHIRDSSQVHTLTNDDIEQCEAALDYTKGDF